ncbi:hypothetical protein FisN_22Hh194 [Fistulifera solaris]|jgi:hypothetical protein|uniref:Fungal lipase-type domain-containing protein n=1 Tax=Fistulifera solaris TaxID=1519565 RepID=A0A1Z5JPY8_FISSO|nr:hypothetical protein FisN_22Hh194 [Fistulifera solaris]|eukprot:GAX15956.1 hypothetical protein FisN_22Hh194 [Fistulifera solaris]
MKPIAFVRRISVLWFLFSDLRWTDAFQILVRSLSVAPREVSQRTRRKLLLNVKRLGADDSLTSNKTQANNSFLLAEKTEEDFNDMSGWVTGLRQWPLIPIDIETKETKYYDSSNEQSSGGFPLTRILNMEALLAFATRKGEESEVPSKLTTEKNELNDDIVVSMVTSVENNTSNTSSDILDFSFLEELSAWDKWVDGLRENIGGIRNQGTVLSRSSGFLRQTTSRIESLLVDASSVVSPRTLQATLRWASETILNQTLADRLLETARDIALDRGLNMTEATESARGTTDFTIDLVTVADGVLRKGYVEGDPIPRRRNDILYGIPSIPASRALFSDFPSAVEINVMSPVIVKDAEMGALAGAIYQETVPRTQALGQNIVAQGVSEDVKWMITDSIANETSFTLAKGSNDKPFLVRTITIRGYDASDEAVDRERLLNRVCAASPELVDVGGGVYLHSGLRNIAKAIYNDTKQYIDWTAPDCKIVLNGHSIGGSLSILVLFEMILERGSDYVLNKIKKVYTYGSPPIATLVTPPKAPRPGVCYVLNSFGVPSSFVSSYIQPWDPIVRLFSGIDALYPLVGDLGTDGVTPWANGPPRTLRPVVKALLEAWDGWPSFRANIQVNLKQNYTIVGTPFLLLPDPTRYLADRYFSVNIPVPAVETILRLSPHEVLPALGTLFVLDVFELSLLPQAIRGFVHHFYPAYDNPLIDYARRMSQKPKEPQVSSVSLLEKQKTAELAEPLSKVKVPPRQDKTSGWRVATQWFQGE